MESQTRIVVASSSRPVLDLIKRACLATGEAIAVTETSPQRLLAEVPGLSPALVVLHGCGNMNEWLDLSYNLHHEHPGIPVLVIGEHADIGVVARGIASGVRNYVPLSSVGPPSDVARVVTEVLRGQEASPDSIYGRVRAMLPRGPFDSGNYRNGLGKVFSREAAIQQCIALGLSAQETARLLAVPEREATDSEHRSMRKPRVPLLHLPAIRSVLLVALAVAGVMCLVFLASRLKRIAPLPYELASVSGSITLDGKPLRGGVVRLAPDNSRGTRGPHGVGIVDSEGRFTIKTAGHDGAVVGSHRVTVLPLDPNASKADEPTNRSPSKYGREATSGLACVVSRDELNRLSLALLSAAPVPTSDSPKKE